MRSTTTDKVIDCLENIFSRHGLPVSIRSDCRPQFLSSQFQDFCEENGIQHVKTTPVGTSKRRSREAKRIALETDPHRTGERTGLAEGTTEVRHHLQIHCPLHYRQEPRQTLVQSKAQRRAARHLYT